MTTKHGNGQCGTLRLVVLAMAALLLLGLSFSLAAATPPMAELSFPAKHDHIKGSCRGKLVIANDDIRFEGAAHSFEWPYGEVQEVQMLDNGHVRVTTYEDSGKLRLGSDRQFNFAVEGDLKEAAEFLASRLDQRLVVGFASAPETVLARFPVKHLRPIQGESGELIFGDDTVVFQSAEKGASRTWRYEDIENITAGDPFHLTISTFERQKFHYATRRVFNFQLKKSISEETYDSLWRRLNRSSKLDVLDSLKSEPKAKSQEPSNGTPVANSAAGH